MIAGYFHHSNEYKLLDDYLISIHLQKFPSLQKNQPLSECDVLHNRFPTEFPS